MRGGTAGPDPLFIGIATTSDVDEYLDGAAHNEVTALDFNAADGVIRDVEYTTHEGTGTLSPPGAEPFWATSVEGTGLLTLDWTVQPGDWAAIIMNADRLGRCQGGVGGRSDSLQR